MTVPSDRESNGQSQIVETKPQADTLFQEENTMKSKFVTTVVRH